LKTIKKNLILIKIILALGLSLDTAKAQPPADEGILAFGDIRSHIEPCGCDPRTDVGGVRRIAAAVSRYRRQFPKTVVVNLGNDIKTGDVSPAADSVKKVLSIVRPDISLVNAYEWSALKGKRSLAGVPWLLSNVDGDLKETTWSLTRKVGDFEFFGYLGLVDKKLLPAGEALFKQWRKITQSSINSRRVLLFSGPDSDLVKIVRTKFFSTIIRSSKVPLNVEMGDQEQKNERMLVTELGGETIWSVPFGGAGLLRLSGLERTLLPKPVSALLQDRPKSKPPLLSDNFDSQKTLSSITSINFVHWLRLEEESGVPAEVLNIFESLRRADRDGFAQMVTNRSKEVDKTEFIGAEACAGCHASSYEIWKKSRHATAITTLVQKNRHEDLNCIECHVLGFKAKGGYVSEGVTPKFANVQCENCHGPRRLHVQAPTKNSMQSSVMDPNKSCQECHTPPHSPGFEQKKYWKAIEHK
jgi:hypothetical protein